VAARRSSRSAVRRELSDACAQRRLARRGVDGAGSACQRDARSSPQRRTTRGATALLIAHRSAVDVRREALGQLRGVIVTATDQLRQELRGLPVGRLLERCSRLRRSSSAARTSSRCGSCCAASPIQSKRPPSKPPNSNASCSGTSAHWHHAARRAGRRTDRRRATDRRLITLRPAALRGRLRPPRRHCPDPRLQRPHEQTPTQLLRRPPNTTASCTRSFPPPPARPG
jgi:hypothetical protein